jgi:hypothetical protein
VTTVDGGTFARDPAPVTTRQILGMALLIAAVAGIRLLAARQVSLGRGRFSWLFFLPTLAVGVIWLVRGVTAIGRDPVLGAILVAPAVAFLAVIGRATVRMSRITATSASDGRLDEIDAETGNDMVALISIALLVGLFALVGLLVFAEAAT